VGSRLSQKEQGNPEVRTLKRAQDALENLVHRADATKYTEQDLLCADNGLRRVLYVGKEAKTDR
jgi:hypothetical protein